MFIICNNNNNNNKVEKYKANFFHLTYTSNSHNKYCIIYNQIELVKFYVFFQNKIEIIFKVNFVVLIII